MAQHTCRHRAGLRQARQQAGMDRAICSSTASLLACLLALLLAPSASAHLETLSASYCASLAHVPAARDACMAHINATTPNNRLCSAQAWKQTHLPSYFCSGLNDACQAMETRLSLNSTSGIIKVCSPLPEGTRCATPVQYDVEPRCVKGVCTDKFGVEVAAPVLAKKPAPSTASLAGARISTLHRDALSRMPRLASPSPSPKPAAPPAASSPAPPAKPVDGGSPAKPHPQAPSQPQPQAPANKTLTPGSSGSLPKPGAPSMPGPSGNGSSSSKPAPVLSTPAKPQQPAGPKPAAPPTPAPPGATNKTLADSLLGLNQKLLPAPPKDEPAPEPEPEQPAIEAIQLDLDVLKLGREVPLGFLGASMEWQGIAGYGRNPEAWGRLFGALGPGAIIRVGGYSQEELTDLPSEESWAAMAKLYNTSGTRFIVGVQLRGNNETMINGMVARAKQLPKGALAGIELGNEPAYWRCFGVGGWDKDGVFAGGWKPYASYFDRIARKVSGCDQPGVMSLPESEKIFIGPGWDNLNTLHEQSVTDILGQSHCYLKDYSLHYYPYYRKSDFNHHTLLAEDLMREAVRNITQHLEWAGRFGYSTLRITEANSLSGAGLAGTSDAFAAALWTADLGFEFAAAGVSSLAFHWGHGGLPEGGVLGGTPVYAGVRTYFHPNGTSAPMPRAPFWGYLLFQSAAAPKAVESMNLGHTKVVGDKPGRLAPILAAAATPACSAGQIKVWPILHAVPKRNDSVVTSELRVAILNKSDKVDCHVTLRLNDAFFGARLARMATAGASGDARMASKLVSFGGAAFLDLSGRPAKPAAYEPVPAVPWTVDGAAGGSSRLGSLYDVFMPAATAAMLVVEG